MIWSKKCILHFIENIDQVVFQKYLEKTKIVKSLKLSLKNKSMAHAYLFQDQEELVRQPLQDLLQRE